MQLVGLTGGIASGKSTSSHYLKEQGIPVIDVDEISRRLSQPGGWVYDKICRAFPQAINKQTGRLDRAQLASLVFQNKKDKVKLEAILHPWIKLKIIGSLLGYWIRGYDRVILDIPLLFESGLQRFMSFTVVINASEERQAERLQSRNGLTRQQSRQRIEAQMPLNKKCQLADIIIDNETSLVHLYHQLGERIVKHHPNWLIHRILFHAIPMMMGWLGIGFLLINWLMGK